jgi:hypothetical protein
MAMVICVFRNHDVCHLFVVDKEHVSVLGYNHDHLGNYLLVVTFFCHVVLLAVVSVSN